MNVVDAQTFEKFKEACSNPRTEGDQLWFSVAIDGDYAFVGAPQVRSFLSVIIPFEESTTEAKTYNLWANGDFLNYQTHNKKKGTSCRCIKE